MAANPNDRDWKVPTTAAEALANPRTATATLRNILMQNYGYTAADARQLTRAQCWSELTAYARALQTAGAI
jgi:hypothetical protein